MNLSGGAIFETSDTNPQQSAAPLALPAASTAATATTAPPRHPVSGAPDAVYPTVAPETIWVPIVTSIVLFPTLVLLLVLLLRRRAMRARARQRITQKRDAVRYTQASSDICKVRLQSYDGLETGEFREPDDIYPERRKMNYSCTFSTDLEEAGDRVDGTCLAGRDQSLADLTEVDINSRPVTGPTHRVSSADDDVLDYSRTALTDSGQ